MKEDDAVAKVSEFMANLDTIRRYKRSVILFWKSMGIFLVAMALILSMEVAYALVGLFTGGFDVSLLFVSPLVILLNILFFFVGLLAIAVYIDQRVSHVKEGNWEAALSEGFPGALKLLLDMDWESVMEDTKTAKLGLMGSVIANVAAVSLIILFILSAINSAIIPFIFHIQLDFTILVSISILLAILQFRKGIDEKLKAVWGMDYLSADLRWFVDELKRAELET